MNKKLIKWNGVDVVVFEDGGVYVCPFYRGERFVPGRKAKPMKRNGYERIYINGKTFTAHRVVAKAFLPDYSEDLQVDHIDGNRSNNIPSNLRMVTNSRNQMGRVNYPRGSCKYRGVSLFKPSGKYVARICKDQKIIHLGYFDKDIDAAKAYNKKAVELGFFNEALNVI